MNKYDKLFVTQNSTSELLIRLFQLIKIMPEEKDELIAASSRANRKFVKQELDLAEQGWMTEY